MSSTPDIPIREYVERLFVEREKRDIEWNRRLDERFESQEKAINAALAAAEKAVTAAFAAAEKAVNAALVSAEKAVEKAEASQARVNETQNEFRGTLRDQAADLMPRSETELLIGDLREQLGRLQGTRQQGLDASLADRADRRGEHTLKLSLVGAGFAVLAFLGYAAVNPRPAITPSTVTVTAPSVTVPTPAAP